MNHSPAHQFAEDWLLVIQNDYDSWNQLIDDVKAMNCDFVSTIAYLREEWYHLLDQMADAVEDKVSPIAALLVRQMLFTGDYAFQIIASAVIESIKETEKHQPEVDDLVKSKEEAHA